jgi:uncharacterized protein with ParB-like and HNH nuclease domain
MRAIETSLQRLFSAGFFKIPDYQRPYAWQRKNVQDLYEDITSSALNNEPHYLGTISLKRDQSDDFPRYDIIDGQQRLTTLYIFALAFYTIYTERKLWKDVSQQILFEAYFLKNEGLKRLELGNLNREFFGQLVDAVIKERRKGLENFKKKMLKKPVLETNKRLIDALEFFLAKLNNETDENLEEIYKFLKSDKLNLVKLEVDNDILAIKIFEVINDRGLPLSYIDKFKSHLMFLGKRSNLGIDLNAINQTFGAFFSDFDTIKSIGKKLRIDYIDKYLRDDDLLVYLYHYSYKYYLNKLGVSSQISYEYNIYKHEVWDKWLKLLDSLRDKPKKLEMLINGLLKDLIGLTNSLLYLLEEAESKTNEKLFKLIVFLQPNVRTWHFLTAAQLKDFLNNELITLAESMDVRIYKVRGTDPRRDLYLKVISELKASSEFPLENLKDFIKAYGSDAEFEHYLKRDMYGNMATKYIFWEMNHPGVLKQIEKLFDLNFGTASFDMDNIDLYQKLEIEHIFPQEFPANNFKVFNFNDEAEYRKFLNMLGNLTLIESNLNKECSNKLPKEKVESCYFNSQIPYTQTVLSQYIRKYGFKKDDIKKLTDFIVEFAKKRFAVPN